MTYSGLLQHDRWVVVKQIIFGQMTFVFRHVTPTYPTGTVTKATTGPSAKRVRGGASWWGPRLSRVASALRLVDLYSKDWTPKPVTGECKAVVCCCVFETAVFGHYCLMRPFSCVSLVAVVLNQQGWSALRVLVCRPPAASSRFSLNGVVPRP